MARPTARKLEVTAYQSPVASARVGKALRVGAGTPEFSRVFERDRRGRPWVTLSNPRRPLLPAAQLRLRLGL